MIFLQLTEFKKEFLNKIFNPLDMLGRAKIGIGISLLLSAGCATPGESRKVAQAQSLGPTSWVELGPSSQLSVRTLAFADSGCPDLSVGQKTTAMSPRAPKSADFPVLVCEAKVPSDSMSFKIKDQILPVLKKSPTRIVLIGDTGCQVVEKKGVVKTQNCNSKDHWPFAQIAKSAAQWHPDLVIHVGDYHYREAACPEGDTDCQGITPGDNLVSWQEDFFTPAKALLSAAPWIFVRGNHELCERGGKGWFHFLDLQPYSQNCTDQTAPFWVDLGDHSIAVIDSADDKNIQPSLDQLPVAVNSFRWLTLHRPFLTTGADDEMTTKPAQLKESLVDQLSVVFTGHQHRLSLNQFSDRRPPELITGNGGTKLEKAPSEVELANVYRDSSDFGFLTLEKVDAVTWKVAEHDREGTETIRCVLNERQNQKATLVCE